MTVVEQTAFLRQTSEKKKNAEKSVSVIYYLIVMLGNEIKLIYEIRKGHKHGSNDDL